MKLIVKRLMILNATKHYEYKLAYWALKLRFYPSLQTLIRTVKNLGSFLPKKKTHESPSARKMQLRKINKEITCPEARRMRSRGYLSAE